MSVQPIARLGNPVLRVRCSPVTTFGTDALRRVADDLRDTLGEFRSRNGFGRGIAAPQIESTQRILFVDAGDPMALVNPAIVRRSRTRMTLWDDCFSFPDLVVKLKRSVAVEVTYHDLEGRKHRLEAEGSLAELLQHEIDHLDGVLAIDRAIDSRHIVYRKELHRREKPADEIVM
jgi:peptide deformylase